MKTATHVSTVLTILTCFVLFPSANRLQAMESFREEEPQESTFSTENKSAFPSENLTERDNALKWTTWNAKLQELTKGQIPKPCTSVQKLTYTYLTQPSIILDIGCATGRNAACLLSNGHRVVLVDMASNAIDFAVENLTREGLSDGIENSVISRIEDLSDQYGPYDAVIATYVTPFIPPLFFIEIMGNNILKRVKPGGYFVGNFFGPHHEWAHDTTLSVVTIEEVRALFDSQGFEIL